MGLEEAELLRGSDDPHPEPRLHARRGDRGLGGLGSQLGDELGRGDAHGAGESQLLVDVGADARGDLSSLAQAAAGTGGVEEGLVESDRLDEGRHRLEDLVHLRARLGVERVVAAQEERMRAELLR
jgi:hypothetical protein